MRPHRCAQDCGLYAALLRVVPSLYSSRRCETPRRALVSAQPWRARSDVLESLRVYLAGRTRHVFTGHSCWIPGLPVACLPPEHISNWFVCSCSTGSFLGRQEACSTKRCRGYLSRLWGPGTHHHQIRPQGIMLSRGIQKCPRPDERAECSGAMPQYWPSIFSGCGTPCFPRHER